MDLEEEIEIFSDDFDDLLNPEPVIYSKEEIKEENQGDYSLIILRNLLTGKLTSEVVHKSKRKAKVEEVGKLEYEVEIIYEGIKEKIAKEIRGELPKALIDYPLGNRRYLRKKNTIYEDLTKGILKKEYW